MTIYRHKQGGGAIGRSRRVQVQSVPIPPFSEKRFPMRISTSPPGIPVRRMSIGAWILSSGLTRERRLGGVVALCGRPRTYLENAS